MKIQKIHNAARKLVGILYIEDDGTLRIENVKDGCKTIIIIKENGDIRVETFFVDRVWKYKT